MQARRHANQPMVLTMVLCPIGRTRRTACHPEDALTDSRHRMDAGPDGRVDDADSWLLDPSFPARRNLRLDQPSDASLALPLRLDPVSFRGFCQPPQRLFFTDAALVARRARSPRHSRRGHIQNQAAQRHNSAVDALDSLLRHICGATPGPRRSATGGEPVGTDLGNWPNDGPVPI
jgi:hypothetical protein